MSINELQEDIDHNKELISSYKKSLRILELKAAKFGLHIPLYVQIEIDSTNERISASEEKIKQLEQKLLLEKRKSIQIKRDHQEWDQNSHPSRIKHDEDNKFIPSTRKIKKNVSRSHLLILQYFNIGIIIFEAICIIYFYTVDGYLRIQDATPSIGLLYIFACFTMIIVSDKVKRKFLNHPAESNEDKLYLVKLSRIQIIFSCFSLIVIVYPQLYYSDRTNGLSEYILSRYPNISRDIGNAISSFIYLLIIGILSVVIGGFILLKIKKSLDID